MRPTWPFPCAASRMNWLQSVAGTPSNHPASPASDLQISATLRRVRPRTTRPVMTNHSRRDLAPTIQYACTGMVAPGVAFSSHRHGRQFALAGRLTLRAALGQALLQGGRQILVRPRQAGTELVVREDLLCHGRLPRQNDHALNLADRGKPDERASGETVLSPFGVRKVQARGRKALAIEGERPGGRV